MKIGDQFFSSYEEYEKAYLAMWYKLHQNIQPDMNWIKSDWGYRKENCKQA